MVMRKDILIGRLADRPDRPLTGFELVYLKGGVVCFGLPGQVRDRGSGIPPDGYVVNFSEDYFRSFLLDPGYFGKWTVLGGAGYVCELNGGVRQKTEVVLEEMVMAYQKDGPTDHDLVKVLLLQVLLLILERNGETGEKRQVVPDGRIC